MGSLSGRKVLVVEDEYFLAVLIEDAITEAGGSVIGPFAEAGLAARELHRVDAAVLNVRVRDGLTYSLARRLLERGIPLVFATGQEQRGEPVEWHRQPWLVKPYETRDLVSLLASALAAPEKRNVDNTDR